MEKFENQVFEYLKKVSKHLYQDDNNRWMKIIIEDEKVKILKYKGYKYQLVEVNWKDTAKWSKGNAKCMMSLKLFLNQKYYSVRQNKWRKSEIENIMENIMENI